MKYRNNLLVLAAALLASACENSQLSGNQPASPAPGAVEAWST